MAISIGLVGLPNAGKSTLFNALTRAGAHVGEYPFSTIEPNRGITNVPDERLYRIASKIRPREIVPAAIEFIDVAGLVRGASQGEGLGNQFLAHIRDVDAIVMVVRCFDHPNVPHVYETLEPKRDIENINVELCLADLAVLEKPVHKTKRAVRNGKKELEQDLEFLLRLQNHLDGGIPARLLRPSGQKDVALLRDLNLLTSKPVLYVANISETQVDSHDLPARQEVDKIALGENRKSVSLCAQLESELAELSQEEVRDYLALYGLEEPKTRELIRASYDLLDMVTFFTFGEYGLKAWTVPRGTTAPVAAGRIHDDMERGFIRLEVVSWREFVEIGSIEDAHRQGMIRLEGKEYAVQDGDIIYVRFQV